MRTIPELEQKIIRVTTKIKTDFPELSKYILEMPENNSASDDINTESLEEYYYSLVEFADNYADTHKRTITRRNVDKLLFSEYPTYAPSEDIYRQDREEINVDPENITQRKFPNNRAASWNEKNFRDDMSGDDLDVPGSELDDQQEIIGSEDEENNYYSLGGDNHKDLEEDRG
ncbi:hypothetical protein [Neolewinella antarctica]|uniref:Uncharacterized protein n=1 Tax=Neolewinella antarctica TaxID=442734 RepID=A0ABX0XCP9_9BACT|nr:hypothetical protein [Neolewinella antarctica]NJC26967.1 hypothetical protein [Neolewinella antarctica]